MNIIEQPWEADNQRVWTDDKDGSPIYIASLKFEADNNFDDDERDQLTKVIAAIPDLIKGCRIGLARIESDVEGGPGRTVPDGDFIRSILRKVGVL